VGKMATDDVCADLSITVRMLPKPCEIVGKTLLVIKNKKASIKKYFAAVLPLDGCTKSSLKTRTTPNPILRGFMYSAKEKWNLDFSQFLLVQFGFFESFSLFPNIYGSGSIELKGM
jgi:hypothetical protein